MIANRLTTHRTLAGNKKILSSIVSDPLPVIDMCEDSFKLFKFYALRKVKTFGAVLSRRLEPKRLQFLFLPSKDEKLPLAESIVIDTAQEIYDKCNGLLDSYVELPFNRSAIFRVDTLADFLLDFKNMPGIAGKVLVLNVCSAATLSILEKGVGTPLCTAPRVGDALLYDPLDLRAQESLCITNHSALSPSYFMILYHVSALKYQDAINPTTLTRQWAVVHKFEPSAHADPIKKGPYDV